MTAVDGKEQRSAEVQADEDMSEGSPLFVAYDILANLDDQQDRAGYLAARIADDRKRRESPSPKGPK